MQDLYFNKSYNLNKIVYAYHMQGNIVYLINPATCEAFEKIELRNGKFPQYCDTIVANNSIFVIGGAIAGS